MVTPGIDSCINFMWKFQKKIGFSSLEIPWGGEQERGSSTGGAIKICYSNLLNKPNICAYFIKAKKKLCGFPVSRPYLAFGRRNPDPKLFYWIMLVSVST